MYHFSMKKYFSHEHALTHMIHDERFWGIVALILLLAFIFLAVWLSPGEQSSPPSTFFKYY